MGFDMCERAFNMKSVLNLYVCHNCLKECKEFVRESPDDVLGEFYGYDELNDCEYCYQLDSVVKESD